MGSVVPAVRRFRFEKKSALANLDDGNAPCMQARPRARQSWQEEGSMYARQWEEVQ
jgi:hypothetical protein